MYDQMSREFSGGEMVQFARKATPAQLTILKAHLSSELHRMLPRMSQGSEAEASPDRNPLCEWARGRALRPLVESEGPAAYDHRRFRNGGEVHKMYDRYSLAKALESAGFAEIKRVSLSESPVANWSVFDLDAELDRSTYRSDSFFMEAILL